MLLFWITGEISMSSQSNDNGRALEYKIVECLLNTNLYSSSNETLEDQRRDIGKYNSLKKELKNDFDFCAPKIVTWILNKLGSQNNLKIDRLKDADSHVADIQFKDLKENIILNLSIKNNHDDLKHPRPYSTAQACGFVKNSPQDLSFRKTMEIISNDYRKKNISPHFLEYNQTGKNLICLYDQVCNHHVTWLNHQSNSKIAKELFTFMVNTNFYKIKVRPRTKKTSSFVEVTDFRNIKMPDSFKVYRPQKNPHKNHFRVNFNNDWELNFRIHTAATKIKENIKLKDGSEKFAQLSLKFAVSSLKDTVSSITIK
jgi:hypothetical protein